MLERETKYLLPEGKALVLQDIVRLAHEVNLGIGESGTKVLVSLYFDSAHYDLAQRGIGLRFRYVTMETDEDDLADGSKKGIWGVKLPTLSSRNSHAVARTELELAGVAAHPPMEFYRPLAKLLGSVERMGVVAEIKNTRTWAELLKDGLVIGEVDVDRVVSPASDAGSYIEVEIEARGEENYLACDRLGRQVISIGGIASTESKLERALKGRYVFQVPSSLFEITDPGAMASLIEFELQMHCVLETSYLQWLDQLMLYLLTKEALGQDRIKKELWLSIGVLVFALEERIDSAEYVEGLYFVQNWILGHLRISDEVVDDGLLIERIRSVAPVLPLDLEAYWVYELAPLAYIERILERGLVRDVDLVETLAELRLAAKAFLSEYLVS